MIECDVIIKNFYNPNESVYDVLTIHSRQVADLAVLLAQRLIDAGQPVDIEFVEEAAMLHDIGIIRTDAAGICCYGSEPYLRHGVIGREMLESMGLFRHALVCERHTGAGLSLQDIIDGNLPLPHRDLLPVSVEEKLVCYADKFFSKTHLGEPPKPIERVRAQLARFGQGTINRFEQMENQFGLPI